MWLDLQKPSQMVQELISNYSWTIKPYSYTILLSKHTNRMVINSQVFFHKWLFTNPVKPQKVYYRAYIMSMNGIIKDVCDVKLLPMTISAYPVDYVCSWHLLKTQHCCICPNRRYNLTSAPPTCSSPCTSHLWYYSSCEKIP